MYSSPHFRSGLGTSEYTRIMATGYERRRRRRGLLGGAQRSYRSFVLFNHKLRHHVELVGSRRIFRLQCK